MRQLDNFNREIDLYSMLPSPVNELLEFKEITKAQNAELNRIRLYLINIFKDRFVNDATEHGLRRWEKMLRLQRRSTDTMDERRFRILTKMNNRLPYTFRTMIQRLNALCGEGNYQVFLNPNAYEIDFEFYQRIIDVNLLKQTMEEMIPVNLTLNYDYVMKVPSMIIIPKAYFYPVLYPICGLTTVTKNEKGMSGKVLANGVLQQHVYEVPYATSDMLVTY